MSSAPFSSLPADAQRVGMSGRRFPRFVQLPGDNHTAIVSHIDSGEDLLGAALLAFAQSPD